MPVQTSFSHRPPRAWTKLTLTVPEQYSDTVCALLTSFIDGGIEQSSGAPDHSGTLRETISAYLPEDQDPTPLVTTIHDFLATINKKIPATDAATLTQERIEEEDWNSRWKEHFKPFKLTNRLVIKPSWEEYHAQPGELVLEMDPGMAFGTGLHASTRLALQLIDETFSTNPPNSVLDVGTGTGILGMYCALQGAKSVVGIDNDIDARTAAAENIVKNRLEAGMTISPCDLHQLDGRFDLVIANITQDVLTQLAPEIIRHLVRSGSVVLSGILTGEQSAAIKALYGNLGFAVANELCDGEWTGLLLHQVDN